MPCRPAVLLVAALGLPAPAAAAELSEAARWLQGYLRIDTSNPPGQEHRGAAYLQAILRREGIPSRILASPRGRTSLYARLDPPGEGTTGRGALLLLHHLDVVAPGGGWTADPFGGEVRDGRLWGRGAVDAKSLGIAHLAAFVGLHRRGVPLARSVLFLGVADEEAGGGEGTAWLLERHPDLFAGLWAVLNEGGANRMAGGRLLWWGIEVAQKRPLWLAVRTAGRGGHASGLNPASAVHRLVRGLSRVLELPPSYRVTDAARTYFSALAPLHRHPLRRTFLDLDRAIAPDGPREPLLPGMASWFLDTVQVTVLEAGRQINVSPAAAEARLDVRLLPDTDAGELLGRIRDALGPGVEVEVLLGAPPAPPSPTDAGPYRLLERELGREGAVVPAFIPGFTDSRHFRERGIPAYGFSPFLLEAEDLRGIHGSDERIPLEAFDRGVARMRRIVELAAAGG